ncbi:MAG: aminotransferase class I/II-fold pyridoxal phosphate-dependent enzyme [Methylococcaceae bacterium]|nr:aminotransferase class I/II-fold pyridoxal phosphate-dependent enzyme [Methylococcaceae bacterium]
MSAEIQARIAKMTVPFEGTLRDAMQAVDRGALGLALLVSPGSGRFMGVVTDGDLRRALLEGKGLEAPVSRICRPNPTVGRIGMSADQLASLFSEAIRILPILDDDERVVDLGVMDRRMRLPVAEPSVGERELQYVNECVLTGWISSGGKFVSRFEEIFAAFCETRYAVATSNGTTALHLALLALGVGPGDEVIVPTLTFIATANAVVYTGAAPVFVDSEPETWNIAPAAVEAAISDRTKAIIPVHLYGHPANMAAIMAVAERHGLAVIEDAAEAHGARYRGKRVGGIGDVGVFSFFGNKIVTTGEGGMLVTSNAEIADRARLLRDHGMRPERRYWHTALGYNYRLTNLQAAVGVAQMEKIDAILKAKRDIAALYKAGLTGLNGLTLPPEQDGAENVFWLYTVLVDEERFGMGRDELMRILAGHEVETRPVFYPVHTQPIYSTGQGLPVAEDISRRGLSLPSAASLLAGDVDRVCALIRGAARGGR